MLPAESRTEEKKSRPARPMLQGISRHLSRVATDGDSSFYVSGYAYHLRRTYGTFAETLNETAWGGGYGKTLCYDSGDAASIAFTAFLDSMGEVEYNLGYMREWCWTPAGPDF